MRRHVHRAVPHCRTSRLVGRDQLRRQYRAERKVKAIGSALVSAGLVVWALVICYLVLFAVA